RFYISLEDDLMRRFGGEKISNLMDKLGLEEDVPLEHGLVSKSIETAQTKVEAHNFDLRKHVVEYDDVMNRQREIVYADRHAALDEEARHQTIMDWVDREIDELVDSFFGGRHDDVDLDAFTESAARLLPSVADEPVDLDQKPDEIKETLKQMAEE